jgi:hypothetical protein
MSVCIPHPTIKELELKDTAANNMAGSYSRVTVGMPYPATNIRNLSG